MDGTAPEEPSDIPCEVFKTQTPDAQAKEAEAKRLRELFKYFSAICKALGFVDNDTNSQKPFDPDSAKISPDPVLNALAQLATIRLRTHRAIISLIDNEYQYIIAESTQTVSLYDKSLHQPNDKLCFGARPLDLASGICAGTVHVFHDDSKRGTCISTQNIFADRSRYVINDLSKESIYKDRPYIRDFPSMRYYAEVPIRTSSDHVIGTLSVYHHTPRQGLSDEDYLVLEELASTTMRHLEKIKVQEDHAQASRLLQGLNSFVQQDDVALAKSFDNHLRKRDHLDPSGRLVTEHPNKRVRASSVISSRGSGEIFTASPHDGYFDRPSQDSSLTPANPSLTPSPVLTPLPPEHPMPSISKDDASIGNISPRSSGKPKLLSSAATQAQDEIETELRDSVIPDEVRETFSRASHILRNAMGLDGVIFLDAALSNFASSSEIPMPASPLAAVGPSDPDNDSPTASDEDKSTSRPNQSLVPPKDAVARNTKRIRDALHSTSRPQYRMSGRLGYSVAQHADASENTELADLYSLPEDLHQSLLRYYPKGHIFNFAPEKFSSPGDKMHMPAALRRSGLHQKPIKRRNIEHVMRLYFPNVHSAIFMPLWNPHKESWFAGSIGWTTDEKRVLQRGDFAYFSVFGNSMMAEFTRLELIASVQAKSDFISSISHELRSPLHGILGSAELLRESDTDSSQEQLIAMVENCGRTLLDTMDHILDFAKINSNPSRRLRQGGSGNNSAEPPSSSGVFENISTFDPSKLVEEITESLIAAHRYNNPAARRLSGHDESQTYASLLESSTSPTATEASPVMVILNIDRRSAMHISSEATGWRRILLNLLGNALKYTFTGFVEVLLRSTVTKETTKPNVSQHYITLIISDTGRGIGKAYLQSHLFTPFIQENNLSSGTGLGLSIVQKMVAGLGGTLNIESELGVGTRVKVSMPVRPALDSGSEQLPIPPQQDAVVCLLGFGESFDNESSAFLSTSISTATKHINALKAAMAIHSKDWLGLRAISVLEVSSTKADIIIVPEDKLNLLQVDDGSGGTIVKVPRHSSLVILSAHYRNIHPLKGSTPNRVQYLFQPFGPRSVAEVLTLALKADRSEETYAVRDLSVGDGIGHKNAEQEGIARQDMQPQSKNSPGSMEIEDTLEEPTKKPNILVVDDNEVNLKILVSYIKKLGYDCATAKNGQEAFDVFVRASRPFDYVLMDVSMPVMDGFTSTRKIRDFERNEKRQPTPIIALTGLGSAQAHQQAFTSGMNMFFTKPVPMKQIKALVEGGVESLQQQQ